MKTEGRAGPDGRTGPRPRRSPWAVPTLVASAFIAITAGAVLGETAAAGAIVLLTLGVTGWAVWDQRRRGRQ